MQKQRNIVRMQRQRNRTFRIMTDVTEFLKSGNVNRLHKYGIIRDVLIDRIEPEVHNKGYYAGREVKVGYFFVRKYGIRGRIFPIDEIIGEREYDIIIQNLRIENGFPPINIDANIYHDFYPGEEILVKISGRGKEGDPSFALFNSPKRKVIGFVKEHEDLDLACDIKIGSEVLVKVINSIDSKRICVFTKSLELLAK